MTTKDDKLVKKAQSMTTGVTASKLELGASLDIHGHSVKITHTDAAQTLVQYANLARRTFDTHSLNSFLELGTFPVGTAFERPTATAERAVIEAVTGDCCYQVRITAGSDMPTHDTFTYFDFIGWHRGNTAVNLQALLDEAAADEANPFETELQQRVQQLEATPEALKFGEARITDLRAKLEAANKALEEAEINGQTRINALQREVGELKADLLRQHDAHTTELLAKNAEIDRLEAKAAILSPVCKEYCVKHEISESELNKMAREGWQIQHMQFVLTDQLHIVFVRDLPASPAPKVVATDAAIYSMNYLNTAVGRPPVQQPPMPAGQTVILNQPVSRPLTNNVSRIPGETKKIPTLADLESQKQRHADEINEIFSRGQSRQEALRRQFASQTSPFQTGG